MTDDLERRLRAADPLPSVDAPGSTDPSLRELVEETMESNQVEVRGRGPRWLPAVAAAVAVAVVGLGTYAVTREDPAALAAHPSPTTTELAMPASDVMSMCIRYSVDVLADMPVAFSGEVVEVRDGSVVLAVDRWYRGGDADQVELASPDGQVLLEGGVEFAQGKRYLVTASEGTVSSCGYTAEWTPSMEDDFETAFAT